MNDLSVSMSTPGASITHAVMPDAPPKVTARGLNTGHFKGQPISADEWVTDVYRKVDGRWLCVLTHLTPVAAR